MRKIVHEEGITPKEAAERLGYTTSCCLESLQTPVSLETRTAQTGKISEKVINPVQPIQTFSIKQLRAMEVDEESRAFIVTNEESQGQLVKPDTEEERAAKYSCIRGIVEPTINPGFNISSMTRNAAVVTGYQRDEKGEPILIYAGSGYHVPVLTYIVRTSHNRPPGYYDRDIGF